MKGSRSEADAWLSRSSVFTSTTTSMRSTSGSKKLTSRYSLIVWPAGLAVWRNAASSSSFWNASLGVELGEEQRGISETRPGDGEGVALEELDRARVGLVLRIVGRDGQALRRDVSLEDEGRARRRRVVQLVVALEGPAARQIAQPDAELVLVAVLELAVLGEQRLVEIALLRRIRGDVGVPVGAGLGEGAGGVERRGAAVGEDERRAVPLRVVAGQPVRRVDGAVDLRGEDLDSGLELGQRGGDRLSRQRQGRLAPDADQRVPVGIAGLANVDPVEEHPEGGVDALPRRRRVGEQLPVLPDQQLLVIPGQADTDVLLGVGAVGLLAEKVRADGLGHVHDLRESVVVVGRLDLERVEVAVGLRGTGDDRELERGEQLARRVDRRDARRVRSELGVAVGDVEVGEGGREAAGHPAALLEVVGGRERHRQPVQQPDPLGQERLAEAERHRPGPR